MLVAAFLETAQGLPKVAQAFVDLAAMHLQIAAQPDAEPLVRRKRVLASDPHHAIDVVLRDRPVAAQMDLALCDNLPAALNVFLGRELVRKVGPFLFLDRATMYARAGQLFAELKSETRPRALVKAMSGGQRQAVAIARTRLADPKIVLMDEPTAAISVRQVEEVLDLIRHLRARGMR